MTVTKSDRSASALARLGEQEALLRLEVLATVSRSLAGALDDYSKGLAEAAEACVPDLCDLLAVELLGDTGEVELAASRLAPASGVTVPSAWAPVGFYCTPDRQAVLGWRGAGPSEPVAAALERLSADSLIVVPIAAGGVTLGWLVLANGPQRRGFRASALRVAVDLANRLGTAIHRVLLHREAQAAAREQARSARWLRRVAGTAASLAGAATPSAVLEAGCIEACIIHDADGALAWWDLGGGRVVTAQAGTIDAEHARLATETTVGRPARGPGWVAWPLPCNDPGHRAVLVLFLGRDLGDEEELALRSVVALVPVAFERALGTETTARHEAQLRAVLDGSPVALLTMGGDGRIDTANPAAQRLFSLPPGHLGSWRAPEEIRPDLVQAVADVARDGHLAHRPIVTETYDLDLSGASLPGEAGQDGSSVVIVANDMSERRRAERALIQAQRLEAMGQVAGRVAHDFNNLLTLIIGYGALLEPSLATDAQREMIDRIDEAAKRAAALTKQMLGFTRRQLTSGVVLDLAAAVANLEPVLDRIAGEGVRVEVQVPPTPVMVRIDPSETEQILVNLAINACDAMEGNGHLSVRLGKIDALDGSGPAAALVRGSYARLSVEDDGPGMTGEILSRCAEPFFTTKDAGRGSGLGLSTVHGIAAERGGAVLVDSRRGAGTRVEVCLPVVDEPASAGGLDPVEEWDPSRRLAGRVLVVDDEAPLRELACRALQDAGLTVAAAAASAEEASTLLREIDAIDVLVTDVTLPGRSGIELARQARDRRADLPIVFMTGYASAAQRATDDVPGALLVLKPFRPEELLAAVAAVLDPEVQGSKR